MRAGVFCLVTVLAASSCVHGTSYGRGEKNSRREVGRRVFDDGGKVEVEDGVARLMLDRNTCIDTNTSYLKNVYESRSFPAPLFFALTLPPTIGALVLGFVSQDPGFFWPEGKPAVTPVSFVGAGVLGFTFLMSGLFPLLAGDHRPKNVLIRSEPTDGYDSISTDCSSFPVRKWARLPYRVWIYGDKVSGTTPETGLLDLRQAALVALAGEKLNPARLRWFEEHWEVYVNFELANAEKRVEKVMLRELQRSATEIGNRCSPACMDASEAKVCKVRERICREEGGDDAICSGMRNTCLEKESTNQKAFEACFSQCARKELGAAMEKKK